MFFISCKMKSSYYTHIDIQIDGRKKKRSIQMDGDDYLRRSTASRKEVNSVYQMEKYPHYCSSDLSRTKQCCTEQHGTGQNRIILNSIVQNRIVLNRTEQNITEQNRIVLNSNEQNITVLNSTEQNSTEQNSTEQISTVRCAE